MDSNVNFSITENPSTVTHQDELEMRETGISVVIAHYNQHDRLSNCLESIFQISYTRFEVVVVDDCSHGDVRLVTDKFPVKLIQLEKNRGNGFARNVGAKNAQFEVIFFIDSDTVMPPNAFQRIHHAIFEEKLDGLTGLVSKTAINKGFTSEWIAYETNYILSSATTLLSSQSLSGVCGAIKKSVYFETGGMYHRYIDDMDFSSRLPDTVQILLDKHLVFEHCYSKFLIAAKKYFIRSYYYVQEKRTPTPWIPRFRIWSMVASIFCILSLPIALFTVKALILSGGFFAAYLLFSCKFFGHSFREGGIGLLGKSILLRFCFGVSSGSGSIVGSLIRLFRAAQSWTGRLTGPFRVYLRFNSPTYVILYVTSHCNSQCSYCFQLPILNNPKRIKMQLTLDEYIRLAKSMGPMEHITLGGGEPFIRTDLADIAIAFYKYTGVRNISIPSNGSLPSAMEKQIEKVLKNCPKMTLRVSLSVDDVGQKHDEMRGLKGNYEKIIEADKLLIQLSEKYSNLYYFINTVYNARNQHRILEIVEENKRRFSHELQAITYVRGDVDDEFNSKDVDANRYFDLVDHLESAHTLKKGNNRYRLELLLQGLKFESRRAISYILKNRKGKYSCRAGKNMLVIDDTGNVHPCEVLPEKFTFQNLRDYGMQLNRLMKEDSVKEIQRRIKQERCFCTWECAHMNSIPFSAKGVLNMSQHALSYWWKRRQSRNNTKYKTNGSGLKQFNDYKTSGNDSTKVDSGVLPVHPMTLEGKEGNPFKYLD